MVQASTVSLAVASIIVGAVFAYEVYRYASALKGNASLVSCRRNTKEWLVVPVAPTATWSLPEKQSSCRRQRLNVASLLQDSHRSILGSNVKVLHLKDCSLVSTLIDLGQKHLFDNWPEAGTKDKAKRSLLAQLHHLDSSYAGGLAAYINNAKRLLRESQDGVAASKHAAFVLVAGGLGERLGYSGIKVKLPVDSARNASFLQEYIESILALQAKHGPKTELPLAIMTSGDTHEHTASFLAENKYFGAKRSQVTLIKQEKVACLENTDARLALESGNPFAVQTKPHGHGDVHALLHASGLANKWKAAGIQWVCFFQDTNGLVFRGLPAALGVSSNEQYDVNSLAVPRKAQEAIGAITSLTHKDGRKMTINVEYNQLDPLLRATTHPEGDVNDESGWSPFPGNINQLIMKMDSYSAALEQSRGIIAEFVNPKYKNGGKTEFKSPTRLECMMQDFPKALPSNAAIGFTVINQVWAAYSPVKNSPKDAKAKAEGGNPSHSATTGELDVYQVNCRALRSLGALVADPSSQTFNGLEVELWPRVSWSPSFAITISDLKSKMSARDVKLSDNATLVISGSNVRISSLDLDGTLVAEVGPHASLQLQGAIVKNRGWAWQPVKEGPGKRPPTEEEAIRGFLVCKREAESLVYHAGTHVYPKPSEQVPAQDGKGNMSGAFA